MTLPLPKYRLELTKGEPLRFISHLDYAELIRRALLRAKIPVSYSEGFNPHIRMTFLAALALGVTSEAEYMDIELASHFNPAALKSRLAAQLPSGVEVRQVKMINPNSPTRKAQPDCAIYEIAVPIAEEKDGEDALDSIAAAIKNFNREKEIIYHRETPKKKQTFDVKEYVKGDVSYKISSDYRLKISLSIRITPKGSVKPSEILQILAENFSLPADTPNALIRRTAVMFRNKTLIEWV